MITKYIPNLSAFSGDCSLTQCLLNDSIVSQWYSSSFNFAVASFVYQLPHTLHVGVAEVQEVNNLHVLRIKPGHCLIMVILTLLFELCGSLSCTSTHQQLLAQLSWTLMMFQQNMLVVATDFIMLSGTSSLKPGNVIRQPKVIQRKSLRVRPAMTNGIREM